MLKEHVSADIAVVAKWTGTLQTLHMENDLFSNAIRRSRVGLGDPERPLHSFSRLW